MILFNFQIIREPLKLLFGLRKLLYQYWLRKVKPYPFVREFIVKDPSKSTGVSTERVREKITDTRQIKKKFLRIYQ